MQKSWSIVQRLDTISGNTIFSFWSLRRITIERGIHNFDRLQEHSIPLPLCLKNPCFLFMHGRIFLDFPTK